MQAKAAEDAKVNAAMRKAEVQIHNELHPLEQEHVQAMKKNTVKAAAQPASKPAAKPMAAAKPTGQSPAPKAAQSEVSFLKSLHPFPISPNSLLQMHATANAQNPLDVTPPVTFKLPSSPVGNVNPTVDADVKKALAEQSSLNTLTNAAVANVEADDHKKFAPVEPKAMKGAYKDLKKENKKLSDEGKAAEHLQLHAGDMVQDAKPLN